MTDEEIAKMVELMKKMKVKPKLESESDFIGWMSGTAAALQDGDGDSVDLPPAVESSNNAVHGAESNQPVTVSSMLHHFPKMSSFSGVTGSGVPYDLWKQEVLCLQSEGHNESTIRQAIRTSLKGGALKVRANVGLQASVKDILQKMDCVYGIVQPRDILLKKFYNATQDDNEDVATWSCRVQELYDDAISTTDTEKNDETLRTIFWSGLRQPLKDITGHLFEKYNDFDGLLKVVRRSEQEHKGKASSKCNTGSSKVVVVAEEQDGIKGMIQQMGATLKSVVDWQKKYDDKKKNGNGDSNSAQPDYRDNMYRQQPPHHGSFQDGRHRQQQPQHDAFQDRRYNQQQPHHDTFQDGDYKVICWRCGQEGHKQIGCMVNISHQSEKTRGHLNYRRPYGRGRR